MAVIRPDTDKPPGIWPFVIGAGPRPVQLLVLSGNDVEGRARFSSCSNRSRARAPRAAAGRPDSLRRLPLFTVSLVARFNRCRQLYVNMGVSDGQSSRLNGV